MKKVPFFLLLLGLYSFSCSSAVINIFNKKTPHEQYAEKLDDKELEDTPEGRQWLAASKVALEQPLTIALPYRQRGYFYQDKPRAMGLAFKANFGERITFHLTKDTTANIKLYADVFKKDESLSTPLASANPDSTEFSFDVDESGTYVLRLQPQLYTSGAYSLSVSVGPSLGFPVSGSKARAGSFWGASRDGGKRKHEGIDIFSPKLTPVVASTDGYITGVREGGLGGKVVWQRAKDKEVFLYYAHLHKQSVKEGQFVKKGDLIGLVGNTGNAKYTPSHLHFGVYTLDGPVDPWPFVNKEVKKAPALASKSLRGTLKLLISQKGSEGTGSLIKANTELVPLAVTAKGYLAELPDGNIIQVPFASAKLITEPAKPADAIANKPSTSSKS